ncbi:unnamed protein product [Victoria cruziana]
MNNSIPFLSLSTLFLIVGATNTDSSCLAIKAYWNEVFPRTSMPNAIQALLPTPTETISGFINNYHLKRDYNDENACPYCSLWFGLGRDPATNTSSLSHDSSTRNWSPDLAPLYFLKEDLQPGSKMNVTIMVRPVAIHASNGEPTFLPRRQAQAIPFSTSNFTTILQMFSIDPHSDHASLIRQTLDFCEMPAAKGEVRRCATSLESMVDFAVGEFGTNAIHAVVTSVVNGEEEAAVRTYKVDVGREWMMSRKVVTCHNLVFPYAVFYCHSLSGTKTYMVPLVAEDGGRVNAIALCHFDTSNWHPRHASFRVLGVKPGTVPICHFILKDLAWVPN